MPPSVQRAWVEGSTAKNSLSARSALLRWPRTKPGSTRAVRACGIDVQDAAQVLRAIYYQRTIDRLAALAGAAAPRQDGHALLARYGEGRDHVIDRFGHDHP